MITKRSEKTGYFEWNFSVFVGVFKDRVVLVLLVPGLVPTSLCLESFQAPFRIN